MKTYSAEMIKIQKDLDDARAENAKMRADLDYVCMVADVEIPTEEVESHEELE